MAKSLRLHVVAEGVETPAQAAMLMEMGCITGQGYLWSPPLELARFRSMAPSRLGGPFPPPQLLRPTP